MNKLLLCSVLSLFAFSIANGAESSENEAQAVDTGAKSNFDGISIALGIGGHFLKNKLGETVENKKFNQFCATTGIRCGYVYGNSLCVAVEVLVDFHKTTEKPVNYNSGDSTGFVVRTGGFSPSMALLVGKEFPGQKIIIYAKGYGTYHRTEMYMPGDPVRNFSSINTKHGHYLPGVALGIEKALCNSKFSVRGEIGYQMPYKRRVFDMNQRNYLKVGGGYSVRGLLVYNVK